MAKNGNKENFELDDEQLSNASGTVRPDRVLCKVA